MNSEFYSKHRAFFEYMFIGFGAAIMALGIGVFLVDAKVVPGGVSGLAMAIHYLTNNRAPVGLMIWVLNVPLYIWGVKELGKKFGIRTFFGFTLNSFFIDFFRGDIPGFGYIRLQDTQTIKDLFTHDFFFYILIGAILLGVGLGIIFKFKGTTAGSDIVAAIMHKKYGVKPGRAIMFTDFFVISIAGLIIGMKGLSPLKPAMSLTLYAFLLLFVSSRLVDVILDGFDYARMAYIISEKNDEIAFAIMNKMNRGVTELKAKGMFTETDRHVLYTVVTNKELTELKEIIKAIDKTAFVIIGNVHEVLGEGFRKRF